MTKNVVSLEWGLIFPSKGYCKVYLEEEDWRIYVPTEDVNRVAMATEQDENLVAVLLAYVSYIRKNTLAAKNNVPKLDQEVVLNSLINLVKGYEHSVQDLINQVKYLKWHELRRILMSSEPAEMLYQTT